MDIIENGISAGADLITLEVSENQKKDLLEIEVIDNGRGIPEKELEKVMDPFYTTRTTRRVGLGLSLFKEAAKRCNGKFMLSSGEGAGTEVYASFQMGHIDTPPMGDMAGSFSCLVMGNPEVDFVYVHEINNESFKIDTRHIKQELDGIPINNAEVIRYITNTVRESLEELKGQQNS
jgi:hypothetical protein